MSGSARDHYERLADSYDENWVHSAAFVNWMNSCILERLDLGADDHAVDLGCGTGLFSEALARHARDVACVDPSPGMLRNLRPVPAQNIVPVQATAEEIASGAVKLPHDRVDAVLIKEAIHHVRDRELVLGKLASLLAPGGRILVVMLPATISYPLFRRALELFEELQPDPEDIAAALRAGGLAAEVTYESYPLSYAKDRYLAMVRNRYMSLLSEFGDGELAEGIREIEREHPGEVVEFRDRFAFVLGRRP